MSVDLVVLLEANQLLLAEVDERLAKVADREAKARAVLQDCEAERRQIGQEKEALALTDRLYRQRFLPGKSLDELSEVSSRLDIPSEELSLDRRPRARIGEQRYRILTRLRQWNRAASIEELSEATGLTTKRIKDQIRSDLAEKILGEHEGRYGLLPLGWDLLSRFEHYKRSKGEPLPPLDGPIGEEDSDNEFSDAQEEEAEHASI